MMALIAAIRAHSRLRPRSLALVDERGTLDYFGLLREIERLRPVVARRRVGLLAENGRHWAVADLAIGAGEGLCVPLPSFFTDEQLGHLIRDADLELFLTDSPDRLRGLLGQVDPTPMTVGNRDLWTCQRTPCGGGEVPPGTAKVTYTSGTSGHPKGVCLAAPAIGRAAEALCEAVSGGASDRALSLLPLATLLENIGGLYAPLLAGGRAQVPALRTMGIRGSSGLDVGTLAGALVAYDPTTLILVPQLLKVLVHAVEAGLPGPAALRFAAVGGAPVSLDLLARARGLGLPIYEGYGLSEAVSAVCLNLPGASRPGSVGRPLPHVGISVSPEGEVLARADGFLGYLGGPVHKGGSWPTGDLGRLDQDGFLHLCGRRKSAFATAFGRNLAPEWVEGALVGHPEIAQAAVFGEGRPFNAAVIVPARQGCVSALGQAVDSVNAGLPDYARVARWVLAREPFTPANGLASPSGALRRAAVAERYREPISRLYEGEDPCRCTAS